MMRKKAGGGSGALGSSFVIVFNKKAEGGSGALGSNFLLALNKKLQRKRRREDPELWGAAWFLIRNCEEKGRGKIRSSGEQFPYLLCLIRNRKRKSGGMIRSSREQFPFCFWYEVARKKADGGSGALRSNFLCVARKMCPCPSVECSGPAPTCKQWSWAKTSEKHTIKAITIEFV